MSGFIGVSIRILGFGCALLLASSGWIDAGLPPRHVSAASLHVGAPPSASIMYVAGGHLWLRSVDGGPARQIPTPWPLATRADQFQNVEWSPDLLRVALDDNAGRLAVIRLSNGRITVLLSQRCTRNCFAFNYAWSPSGRYLAFLRPTPNRERGPLLLWDSATGLTRTLIRGVSGFASGIDWSHDGTRVLVSTGPFDTIKSVFPSAVVVTLSGRVHVLGKGIGAGWSPDDRFVGLVRSHYCGANTCDEAELIQPSGGGPAITLVRHITSTFADPEWAQATPAGTFGAATYAFDRWLLGPAGHLIGSIAGPKERVDSWARDASRAAVESYHPYEETPDALYFSTGVSARSHVFTAARRNSCGACSKDVYRVVWGLACRSSLAAFSTPTYPTPSLKTVYSRLFLSRTGGPVTRIPVPGKDVSLAGFVDRDQELVAQSGGTLYRYVVADRSLQVIARGVTALASPPVDEQPCS
jgi:hypothetical protein